MDITKIKVGQKATMTLDAYPNKTFTGKVTTINTNGSVSSNVTTYPTTISFDDTDTVIYPNMAVGAQIITDIKDGILLVPSSAITGTGDSATVKVLKSGKVQQIPVITGSSNDTQTEITSGLNEGDTIITSTSSTMPGTSTTTSPFGGSGFGGASSLTGGPGGSRVLLQSR
jgi:HlyD family secretion protein